MEWTSHWRPADPAGGPAADPGGPSRLGFRLWQVQAVALTVLAAGWLASLGPVPAVIAAMAAKDILLALLLAGLGHGAGDGGRVPEAL